MVGDSKLGRRSTHGALLALAHEFCAVAEALTGKFGLYLISDRTNQPTSEKIRAPSFTMDVFCRSHMLADVAAILG
jgi:NADH:ubiquinone oxidoreductase subunit D